MPNLYEISNGARTPTYLTKQADAHTFAKGLLPRADVRIRLYDYPNDVDTFCGLMNGVRPKGGIKRAWMLSARGGLVEMDQAHIDRELADEAASDEPSQEDLDEL